MSSPSSETGAAAGAFTYVSAFAGAGGSSCGYRMAGGRGLLSVEWDDNAAECYRLNFPDTPLHHGDVTEISVGDVLERTGLEVGELDLFDGSPPCQGFSTSGKRRLDDPRNTLFMDYARLLEGLRPRAFVMENVFGMVKGKMRLVFAQVLRTLRACGYRVSARLMNAKWYGVPQARERMIFVGAREDLAAAGLEPSHPAGWGPPVSAGLAVRGAPVDEEERSWLLRECATRSSFRDYHRLERGQRYSALPDYGPGSGFGGVRLDPTRPAPTLTKTDSNLGLYGTMHWSERRRLTTAEYRRLFSFPDDFAFTGSWSDAVARMGNSVPPLLIKAVAEHVRDTIIVPSRRAEDPEAA